MDVKQVQIINKLKKATPSVSAAVGLSVCLRMRKCIQAFFNDVCLSNIHAIDAALLDAKNSILNNKSNVNNIDHHIRIIDDLIPDSDEHASEYTGMAQESMIAILHLLTFLKTQDFEEMFSVVQAPINVLDTEIQYQNDLDPNRQDLDEIIYAHPLMLRELERQINDIDMLQEHKYFSHQLQKISPDTITKWESLL